MLAVTLGGGVHAIPSAALAQGAAEADLEIGFAAVDRLAMTIQGHRLEDLGASAPDVFGGVYFSEETGQLNVRYVDSPAGMTLISRLSALTPQPNEVPVRFEPTSHSLHYMRNLATKMRKSTVWAGEQASDVFDVYLDEWRYRINVDVAAGAKRASDPLTG